MQYCTFEIQSQLENLALYDIRVQLDDSFLQVALTL